MAHMCKSTARSLAAVTKDTSQPTHTLLPLELSAHHSPTPLTSAAIWPGLKLPVTSLSR